MVNPMVVGFAVATVLLYIVGYVKDPGNVSKAVRETLGLLFNPSQGFAYIIVAAFFLAGMLSILIPSEVIAAYLGREAGMKGILIGTAAGAVTPGGPFLFFPILLGLYKAGASVGALIAYITAWALLAVHRILTWEFPLMGFEFAASRVLVSLAIPVILGVAGQQIHDLLFSGS